MTEVCHSEKNRGSAQHYAHPPLVLTTSPLLLDPQRADQEHRGKHQEQAIILGGQPDTRAEREQPAIPGNRHIEVRVLTAAKRT